MLNAVNEDDLASLAKSGDGKSVSAIETTTPPTIVEPPEAPTEPTQDDLAETPEPVQNDNDNKNMLIFVGIAVAVIGGVAYYIKIVRPKQESTSFSDYDEYEDDFGDDGEKLDASNNDEEGDDE